MLPNVVLLVSIAPPADTVTSPAAVLPDPTVNERPFVSSDEPAPVTVNVPVPLLPTMTVFVLAVPPPEIVAVPKLLVALPIVKALVLSSPPD